MKSLISLSILFLALIASATAQDDEYTKQVKKYLKAANYDDVYAITIDNMVDGIAHVNPEVSEEIWDEVRKEMKNRAIDELYEKLVPVYKKHFSLEEIKAFVAFYESPAGSKFADKLQVITRESMIAADEWGNEIADQVVEEAAKR